MSGDELRSELPPWAMVPEWLLDSEVSDGAVRLYGVLARYADKDSGCSFPARSTLGKRLRCSVKSIDRRISELVEVGALKVEPRFDVKGDRTSNLYRVLLFVGGVATRVSLPGDTGVPRGGDTGDAHNESHSERESVNPSSAQGALIEGATPKPKKDRPRNPIFDALVAVYPTVTKSEQALAGSVAAELRALIPPPDAEEVVRRARWCRREWPTSTARAVAKNWTLIGERLSGMGASTDAPGGEEFDPQAGMDKRREIR